MQQENVKTLPTAVFDKVDKLASPRLVEYWEQDPCAPDEEVVTKTKPVPKTASKRRSMVDESSAEELGVTIEAKFSVGEYEVVVLSARDSAGLEIWLKQEKYKIPPASEPLLRPYVQGGSKFFVAKVDTKKVRFENGQALLSPLRFHYDSETFALPVRLGLVNSAGTQDLIVHILARGQRYETANYPNVAIPTNLDVKDAVRKDFGGFYAALFDRTMARQPKSVITEYAWDASSCDPCPGPTLDGNDLMTFGMDVLPSGNTGQGRTKGGGRGRMPQWQGGSSIVLTRLHMRYGKDGLGEDLVFRVAPPIVGGREFVNDGNRLETGAVQSDVNNFQARYAIRHAWTGPVKCANPERGIWGGPPGGGDEPAIEAAQKLAFVKRGALNLTAMVARDDKETKIDSGPLVPAPAFYSAPDPPAPAPSAAPTPTTSAAPTPAPAPSSNGASGPPPAAPQGGCAGCRVGDVQTESVPLGATIAAALGLLITRTRRRKTKQ